MKVWEQFSFQELSIGKVRPVSQTHRVDISIKLANTEQVPMFYFYNSSRRRVAC